MNRGILVSRGVPDKKDLIKIAEGICERKEEVLKMMKPTIEKLANGYEVVYTKQSREYFGLRDFYSLVKMLYASVTREMIEPDWTDIIYAVQRNFGGSFGDFEPTHIFLKSINPSLNNSNLLPAKQLIAEAMKQSLDSRYVLLLTKNNAALSIVQDQVGRRIF